MFRSITLQFFKKVFQEKNSCFLHEDVRLILNKLIDYIQATSKWKKVKIRD